MSRLSLSSITIEMGAMTCASHVLPDYTYRAVMQKYKDSTDLVLEWFQATIPEKDRPAMGHYPTLARKVVEREIEVPASIISDLESAIDGRTRCFQHHQQLDNSDEEHEYMLDVLYEIHEILCPRNPVPRPEGLPKRARRYSSSSSRSTSPSPARDLPSNWRNRILHQASTIAPRSVSPTRTLGNWRARSSSCTLPEPSRERWVSPTATARRSASAANLNDAKNSSGAMASENWRKRD